MHLQSSEVSDLTLKGAVLSIDWSNGASSDFDAIWLRDNCRCEGCGVPETGRRQSRLTAIDLDIAFKTAEIVRDQVVVTWSDGHCGAFAAAWLRDHSYDEATRRSRAFTPQLWTDEFRNDPPYMDFEDVSGSDAGFMRLLHQVRDTGLCFLREAPAEAGTLEAFAQRIGPIQESNFGRIQDLVVDDTKQSVGNRTVALKAHTDEPYRASPPGLLMFHCIETDVTGAGSSIFMDGFELAEVVRAEDPEGFAALARNSQPFRRHFAGDVDLVAEFPVISTDGFGNVTGVRINDRVAAPLSIPSEEVAAYYRGLKRLLALSEDPAQMIHLTLRPGDIAVFDNHRILHGRTELTITGRRWLQWLQIERGDFHSALRILADRIGDARDDLPLLRGAYG